MSSKQASTVSLTPAMIASIKATMKNLESFPVNWAGVKDETGVSSNGNAAQAFRNAMKAFGLKVVDSKNWKFADDDKDEAPAGPGTPAKPGKKRGRAKKGETGESPDTKRQKVEAINKSQEDAEPEVKQEVDAGEKGAEVGEVEDK